MALKQGPVTKPTTSDLLQRLSRELRDLETQKANLTDSYNARLAQATSPEQKKQIEINYQINLARLNREIRQKQNQISEEETRISNVNRRIEEDLAKGIYLDPGGNRFVDTERMAMLDRQKATQSAKKPKIVTGRFGKKGIVPGDQPFTGGRGYIDPGTGMYFDTPEDYRNYAMRKMQNRYWDERQGRWVEGAPTGPGAMPGIVDNARPPIMPGQPSFDPGIVTKMNKPPINSPYS